MRAVVVGAVETTRTALHAVAATPGWSVAAVMTLAPELAGRHSDYVDLTADAAAAGARLVHVADCNAPDAVALIAALAADLVLVVGWSQICRAEFQAAASGRVVGYHPAPLPRLRGRAAIPWTILLAEPISAGTLFWIDDGVDTGLVLAQQFFHVPADATAASLYALHLEALKAMLPPALIAIAGGNPPRLPQDERCATWAARRGPEDGLIDWSRPAGDIARLVRAVGRPYPGAFTHLRDEALTIWAAASDDGAAYAAAAPGQVVAVDGEGRFAVRTGCGGILRVHEWHSASGRKPLVSARLR